MEIIQVEHLSFWYPEEEFPALSNVSFTIDEGEFVVLCGASGCGKTTLLKHLKKEIMPIGKRNGHIRYMGQSLGEYPAAQTAAQIGMVFQNPDNQIVMDTVWHELAFSMENMGYSLSVMRKRLAEITQFFGLEPLLYKSVHELSGGQKQMINLASVLMLQPNVLLLDEPTSQLDPVAAREFIQLLHRINQELSMTVILSEHRLEDVIPLADRILMMEQGQVKYEGDGRRISKQIIEEKDRQSSSYLPAITRLYLAMGSQERIQSNQLIPLTVREGKKWIAKYKKEKKISQSNCYSEESIHNLTDPVLVCRDVTFRYEKDAPEVLKKLSLQVYQKEFLAILGGNGAGKSTLLQVMAGLLAPQRGKAQLRDKQTHTVGYLAQNPLLYFSYDTVEEEMLHMAAYQKLADPETEIKKVVSTLGIMDVLHKHPHDISGGQQQKVALAIVMLSKPKILLIDEPTKGLDPLAKQQMADLLHKLREQGTSIVMVTHDVEFAAMHATRCALLFDGMITTEASPAVFFSTNYFYTTSINRVVRDWLPSVLTYEDVIEQWPDFATLSY